MFSIGDKVIYGTTGVCTIVDIGTPDIPGANKDCYILEPYYVSNSRVYAPIEQSTVKMRHLLTKEEATSLLKSLPDIDAFPPSKERNEIQTLYRSTLKSTDCAELIKLLKTLYTNKLRVTAQRKTISHTEKEYFQAAQKILCGEMAVIFDVPLHDISEKVNDALHTHCEKELLVS